MNDTPNIVMLLISTISILGGVIVWLALWIRKMYNSSQKKAEEDKHMLVGIVKENTSVMSEFKANIQANTVATTNAAEQTSRSMDRLSGTIENLNRDVLKNRGGER